MRGEGGERVFGDIVRTARAKSLYEVRGRLEDFVTGGSGCVFGVVDVFRE
jgi:hypothetical protein